MPPMVPALQSLTTRSSVYVLQWGLEDGGGVAEGSEAFQQAVVSLEMGETNRQAAPLTGRSGS